jgi:hypothetical protein
VGFEPTIPVLEQAKTVRALDRAATAIGKNAEQIKENEYWLHLTLNYNHYTALLEENNDQQQQKVGPENTTKPPPIYVSYIITISPLIQLLEQIVELRTT